MIEFIALGFCGIFSVIGLIFLVSIVKGFG